jgi:hypothetical protein
MAVDPGVYSITVGVSNDAGQSLGQPFYWTIEGTGQPVSPVWAAGTSEQYQTGSGSYEFLPQHVGAGAPVFSCASELLLPDDNGVYIIIEPNSTTAHGARSGGGAAGRKILVNAGWNITDGGIA